MKLNQEQCPTYKSLLPVQFTQTISVEAYIQQHNMFYIASDKEVDITDLTQLQQFVSGRQLSRIINCSAYTAIPTSIKQRMSLNSPLKLTPTVSRI